MLVFNVICWKLTKDIAPQSHRILHTFVWCVCMWGGGQVRAPTTKASLYNFTPLWSNIFKRPLWRTTLKLGKFSNFKPFFQQYSVSGYSLTGLYQNLKKRKKNKKPKERIRLLTFIFRTWSSVVVHNRFFFSLYFASIYRAPSGDRRLWTRPNLVPRVRPWGQGWDAAFY